MTELAIRSDAAGRVEYSTPTLLPNRAGNRLNR